MSLYTAATTIERLVLTAPAGAQPADRRRWQRQVASAMHNVTLAPAGMPPNAILIVRRLSDPAPGALLHGFPWQGAARWQSAVQPTIQTLWRNAARPAQEPVTADALAVYFADQAEWMATLTVDLDCGIAGERWWWQSWLAHHRDQPTIRTLWQEEAQWLPAALHLLQRSFGNRLPALIANLDPATIPSLWNALASQYRLPTPFSHTMIAVAEQLSETANGQTEKPAAFGGTSAALPATTFLILALALHNAPAMVHQLLRSAVGLLDARDGAATAIREQAHSSAAANAFGAQPATDTPVAPPQDKQHRTADLPFTTQWQERAIAPSTAPPLRTTEEKHAPAPVWGYAAESSTAKNTATNAGSAGAVEAVAPNAPPLQPTPLARTATMAHGPNAPLLQRDDAAAHAGDTGLTSSLSATSNGVYTAFGGIWYLVNVLMTIDLWQQMPPGIDGWQLLTAIAERLLEKRPPDPLWVLLGELAANQAADGATTPSTPWLDQATDATTTWLVTALTHPLLPQATSAPITAMLQRPARLWISRTHVDIQFNLDQIDLRVRLAGLDRNPGWTPALGRVITFYYQ